MARPETIADVEEKMIRIGSFDLERVVTEPKLLKAYTALIEQLQLMKGTVEPTYGQTVEFHLPRNQKQLQERLRSDQYSWDDHQKHYKLALLGEEVADWRKSGISEWAKEEGLPDPFDSESEESEV
jgi:hypothetical protein